MIAREPYALAATLDSYEVEELDALDIARFLSAQPIGGDVLQGLLPQVDRQHLSQTSQSR
jgi:hypothetical protein